MPTYLKLCLILLLLFALSSCAIQLNDQPPALSPSTTPQGSIEPQGTKIPVTWNALKLTGKLVYIGQQNTPDQIFLVIQMLDLQTGQISTLYQAPNQAIIYALTLSPDHKQLIMSCAIPGDEESHGLPSLYIMPLDGSQPPKLVFAPPTKEDQHYQPVWTTVNGKEYLYFSRARSLGPSKAGSANLEVKLYRMALLDGTPEKLSDNAFWPALSADGTRLVYVSIDPKDGTNQLIAAKPDGANAHPIAMSGGEWIPKYIDAPIFLADGKTVMFSAVSLSASPAPALTWLDQLLGVTVVSAHNIPSDWWSVPLAGGTATQLTHLQTTALFASFSPDPAQTLLASYSGGGIFVMNPDGTNLQMLSNEMGGLPSTLHWIP